MAIPFGQTRTYKWVAKKVGRPKAFRAVGNILNRNPYPLVVPCHRVVSSAGSPGGYAWGRGRKKALLNQERQIRDLMVE
jgi:O-6-methylguanine DNA methyltransferase